jgi:hypothetical protein
VGDCDGTELGASEASVGDCDGIALGASEVSVGDSDGTALGGCESSSTIRREGLSLANTEGLSEGS